MGASISLSKSAMVLRTVLEFYIISYATCSNWDNEPHHAVYDNSSGVVVKVNGTEEAISIDHLHTPQDAPEQNATKPHRRKRNGDDDVFTVHDLLSDEKSD